MNSITLSQNTLVIILGASNFPKAPNFTASKSFQASAEAMRDYFFSTEKFNLPPDNLLYLFDSDKPSTIIDEIINDFLTTRTKELAE